jgi:hypothetical protein
MTTAQRRPPNQWDMEAKRLIKSAMALRGYTYDSLSEAMEEVYGEEIAPKALALRVNRAAFGMGFALQLLVVMGATNLDFSHLKSPPPKQRK